MSEMGASVQSAEETDENDIDEAKSILRLPGLVDILPHIFRFCAEQGQCVLDLRQVCKEFNRTILTMRPAISCKDNFKRNLDDEKCRVSKVNVCRHNVRDVTYMTVSEKEEVFLTATCRNGLMGTYLNLRTGEEFSIKIKPESKFAGFGDSFIVTQLWTTPTLFPPEYEMLLWDKKGRLRARENIMDLFNCRDISPVSAYVSQVSGNKIFIKSRTRKVKKFLVEMTEAGPPSFQLQNTLVIDTPLNILSREYCVSTDGETYLESVRDQWQIRKLHIWRENTNSRFTMTFPEISAIDVLARGDILLVLTRGKGIHCWNLVTRQFIGVILEETVKEGMKTFSLSKSIYNHPSTIYNHPSTAHPDYIVVRHSHKIQTFFLDFETLTAHGVDVMWGRVNINRPVRDQLKYYSGTKKVTCQLETSAGGVNQLVLSVQDYRCHKHE